MIAEIDALRQRAAESILREFEQAWEGMLEAPDAAAVEQVARDWARRAGREALEAGLQAAIEQREQQVGECCGKRMGRHAR